MREIKLETEQTYEMVALICREPYKMLTRGDLSLATSKQPCGINELIIDKLLARTIAQKFQISPTPLNGRRHIPFHLNVQQQHAPKMPRLGRAAAMLSVKRR